METEVTLKTVNDHTYLLNWLDSSRLPSPSGGLGPHEDHDSLFAHMSIMRKSEVLLLITAAPWALPRLHMATSSFLIFISYVTCLSL